MPDNRVHHFKLVLLGDTAVGKSCLVVRFVRDEFFEFQEPTIGGKKKQVLFGRCRRHGDAGLLSGRVPVRQNCTRFYVGLFFRGNLFSHEASTRTALTGLDT